MRTVRPSPQWQDTLIRIEKGQRVVIDAEECWSPDMRNEGYLMPGTNVGALIGKVDDGPIFAIGARYDFFSDWDGVLHLAMNENPEYNNQAGKVVAQVIVFDKE